MNLTNPESLKPLTSHLEEFRGILLRVVIVVVFGFLMSLYFHKEIFNFLLQPFKVLTSREKLVEQIFIKKRITNPSSTPLIYSIPTKTKISGLEGPFPSNQIEIPAQEYIEIEYLQSPERLTIFDPVEGMGAIFRMCFFFTVVITSPFFLSQLLHFILPGLYPHEIKIVKPFLVLSGIFLGIGLAFSYWVTIPLSNAFLWDFNSNFGENLWSLSHYIDFTIFLLLANAFAFELSLVLFFLVHLGCITEKWMIAHRKHMIVFVLMLGALLTPPDIASQLLIAVPLAVLYEIAILYARYMQRGLTKTSSAYL